MLELLFRKKYIILFSFTGVLLSTMYLSPGFMLSSLKKVNTIQLETRSVKSTVSCSGSIYAARQKEIYCISGVRVSKLLVKVGDRVKKGQILMTLMSSASSGQIASAAEKYRSSSISSDIIGAYGSLASYAASSNPSSSFGSYTASHGSSASASPGSSTAAHQTAVKSTLSGTVTELNVEEGEVTPAADPAAVITDLSSVQAKVLINEISIADVKKGQSAVITGQGFHTRYSGSVKQIYPAAEEIVTTSGSIKAVTTILSIHNPGKDLKPGLSANAKITTSQSVSLIAPYQTVQEDARSREYVVLVKNHRAYRTFVKTGREYSNSVQILTGVKAGEELILNPPSYLQNGQLVRTTAEGSGHD